MNIGKKIKDLRSSKMMTQKELAGNEITRNMLSQIENGSATPSISTVIYLANRLGVPTGYLLADGDEEFLYNKISVMRNIKRAYTDGNYELCREMCLASFDEYDDEIQLILADCCLGIASDSISKGRLYKAREFLDKSAIHAQESVYNTVAQVNKISLLFCFLKKISPTLDSDEIDTEAFEEGLSPLLFGDSFSRYIAILIAMDNYSGGGCNMLEGVGRMSPYDELFIKHIKAKQYIIDSDYGKAIKILKELIDGDVVPPRLLLYLACSDMEQCCKQIGDYKLAYEFANNKMEILEHMLVEE